ncbi:MFS transporter [Paraburkholderia sp. EG287B]|uniref:MFS transporter n=1 Tax=unclassified Paraburkholderia TaxID=2615204 RepID=UPI0034D2050D
MKSKDNAGKATLLVFAIVLAVFSYSMLETMLVPVLPQIQKMVNASPAEIGMVFTVLLLAGSVSTPIIGRLADLYEKRVVILCALVFVSIGIAVAATAQSIMAFAVGQFLQGLGFAFGPLSIGLFNDTIPRERVGLANGLIIAAATLSGALGLATAGPIVEAWGFRYIFWIPLGALALAMLILLMAGSDKKSTRAVVKDRSIDWIGMILLSGAIVSFLLAIKSAQTTGWFSMKVVGLAVVACFLTLFWVKYEKKIATPLLDVRLLAKREIAVICVFAFGVGFTSIMSYVLVPLMVAADHSTGYGFAATVTQTGFFLLPFSLMGTLAAPFVSKVQRHIGGRGAIMWTGLFLALGFLMLGYFHQAAWQVHIAMGLIGLGTGFGLTIAMNSVVEIVPQERTTSVSGLVFVLRNIGATLGVSVGVSFLTQATDMKTMVTAWSGYQSAYTFGIVVAVALIVAGLCYPKRSSVSQNSTSQIQGV